MILQPAPEDYQEAKLYRALQAKSKPNDGLLEKVTCFIVAARPLQELIIAGPFKDYTLHNPNHSKKLLHLAGYIIPDDTLLHLSALDLAIMIMAFYLHDLGMVLTQTERERVIASSEFQDFLSIHTDYGDKLAKIREKVSEVVDDDKEENRISLETSIYQVTEAALCDYLRPLHATEDRYRQLIGIIITNSGRSDLFDVSGVSFRDELIEVCISHNLNPSSLLEADGIHRERFPREAVINSLSTNMQYCGAILRLVDILDFDNERTPKSLFNALGIQNKRLPGYEISIREWHKHLAIHTISINEDEIVISGDSRHPSIEHSIKQFSKTIEFELRETQAVLNQNRQDILRRYKLELPFLVRSNIRSVGYIYKDYSIKLNETAIVNLLMGENLYTNIFAAVRELVQNSVDACDLRSKIDGSSFFPQISLSVFKDEDSRSWFRIEDNGIGMDEYVLTNFFFKIGNSYYSSPDFKRFLLRKQISGFVPISRFGIGLLSVFMLGEAIKVTTRNLYSEWNDVKQRTLLVDGVESLAVVTEQDNGPHGTIIDVLLRNNTEIAEFVQKLLVYVRDNIIRPAVPVMIQYEENVIHKIVPDNFIRLNSRSRSTLQKLDIEVVQIDFERFSNMLKGKAIFFFYKNTDGTLSYYDKSGRMEWGIFPLKPSNLFENFLGGSRVTVNGMLMAFKRIGSLYNIGSKYASVAFDIEVSGSEGVEYNVSRQKVYGNGLNTVRKEIFLAIERGLREIGIYDLLDTETKEMMEVAYSKRTSEKLNELLLDSVLEEFRELPAWSEDVYQQIAFKLQTSVFKIKKYTLALVHTGRLDKPKNL